MSSLNDWKVPAALQPKPENYDFDLEHTLTSVVGLRSIIREDAFSAQTLGTERAGNGVVIRRDGVVLTIGYLITEAENIWVTLDDNRAMPGHVLGYDHESGFGLVQVLAHVDLPALPLGDSGATVVGERVVLGGAGGLQRSLAARIVAKQEYCGYWEYALDEAIFTSPAHPNWGGTAVVGHTGALIGIGSLQLQQGKEGSPGSSLNMVVPIDLLKPILDDLMTIGRPNRPARPWLGLYAIEVENRIVVAGLAERGPAKIAKVRTGDVLLAVGGAGVSSLSGFLRKVWALGMAGVEVPLLVYRDGDTLEIKVKSADRRSFLRGPKVH